ncbi:NAD(P)-dependent alcohol dehydrogenase [Paenibacillus sp. MMS20-IR301]|uniref:NAD(P)-dependent alcohol dehydrogenase n=1 Tax=Paenibacillus sp. MMS20-IR301 TaxID=2895946 RepID=UPI0028E1CBD0|nr:NAD(P)-dependent alcohol dehydrogenase [Paenibacillus sp. MMS20-IR301]WNS41912.1 NAD(P)-dependent alcohol dehydrogenase [Paenibacillus sp. MMS20-IR301]
MTAKMMNAAVMNQPLDIELRQVPIPVPEDDEALVKVYCIGICGSDVHYYEHGRIGRYVVEKPIILGHELAGQVVSVGAAVTNVAAGDRVAVEPGVTCGRCEHCKSGRYNLCPDVVFMATPPVDGAWAEYVTVRSDFLFKLPDSMSYEEGALLEPLSVGMHAMIRGKVGPADRLLITGLGPIGLLAVQAARIYGVNEIYATDIVPFRQQLALEMGVTAVLNPLTEDVQARLEELTGGQGIDVVVETSGNGKAVASTVSTVKRGGRVVLVGMPAVSEVPVDINTLIDAELDVYGLFRYANTYPAAIQALSRPGIDIEKVITHKYDLKDTREAVEMARTQKDTSIKIMIYPNM